VVSFLKDVGIHIPPALSAARGTQVALPDGTTITAVLNLPAIIIIALVHDPAGGGHKGIRDGQRRHRG